VFSGKDSGLALDGSSFVQAASSPLRNAVNSGAADRATIILEFRNSVK
jgi:hypothetical protein